jgi:hypothetical protein
MKSNKFKHACRYLGFSFTLVCLTACHSLSEERSLSVPPNIEDFKTVELNSDTQNACSPDISATPDLIGVVINVPNIVEFEVNKPASDSAFAAIPVCGYYQLDMADLLESSAIHLFAKDIETEVIYRGVLVDEDAGTDAPLPFDEPELEAEDLRGQLLSVYFNPNLAKYIKLPKKSASYKVVVQIGKFKSNMVDLKVTKKH